MGCLFPSGLYFLGLVAVPNMQVELLSSLPGTEDSVADAEQTPNANIPAATLDDIFMQVFKQKPPPLQNFEYPVLLDRALQGNFLVAPDLAESDGGSVASSIIAKVLLPVADAELTAQLVRLAGERTMIPFSDLRALGYTVHFDKSRLILSIESKLDMRGVRSLALRPSEAPVGLTITPLADVSAYVSVRSGATLVAQARTGDNGVERVVSDFDIGVNLRGIAAEARLRYDSNATQKLGRGDVRLTYDDRKTSIRYELGDLSIGRRSFQDTPRIMGIGTFRYYNINPYRNIRPSAAHGFELTEPAEIEVSVNGTRLRTFDLGSGRYDLRDLPLVSSAFNDVQLTIRYASGAIETIAFPAFFDLDLIASGLTEFAFNLGIPYRDERNRRTYDSSNYSSMGFVRHGLSSTLTAGINWEGNKNFTLVGSEIVWASPIGTFGINAALDVNRFRTSSGQVNLQYRWRDADTRRGWAIDSLLTLTGAEYRTLNGLGFGSTIAAQGRLRVGRSVGPDTAVQVYGGIERYHGDLPSSRYAGANISHSFGGATMSLEGEFSRRDSVNQFSARLGLSIPLGRGSLSGSATSESNAVRMQYDRSPAQGVRQFGFGAGFERRDGGDRQFLRGSYFGNRFEASVQQTSQDFLQTSARADLRYDLRFGSALVMADGHVAISRPVGNSFAIVGLDRRAGDYRIAVEPLTGFASSQRRYSAYSDAFGPAVVTGLTPYFNRTLQVDAPNAPAGTSVGGQVFVLNPGYRSGAYMQIGSDRNVTAIGNLVDRNGDPVGLSVLSLREVCSSPCDAGQGSEVFTNASGRFFAEGLKPGSVYEIELVTEGRTLTRRLDIPLDAIGLYRLDQPLAIDTDIQAVK